ncbi:MAG: TonB-dependent receptor [Gammaproteobacteria bacterium]|nr:TonB-dependent receptor [Gammaproteobacteria bacterium]
MQNSKLARNLAPVVTVHPGRCSVLLLATAILSTAVSAPVLAQQDVDASLHIEEIIVTARKREESMQETPISISAFTNSDLRQRNLTNLMELSQFTPNVMMNSMTRGGGSGNAEITIRGVGQTDFLFTSDPGVGIYVDGVYLPRTLGGVLDLLDLERVEILRGPQGTLFGKNTIGGAVNLISNKPTQEFDGFAELTTGSFDRIDGRLDLNIPLSETWASRVSLSYKNRDGYVDRLDFDTGNVIDQLGDENAINARAALRWTPSEVTTLDIIADYTREREDSAATVMVQYEPVNGLGPLWNGLVAIPSGATPMSTDFITGDPHKTFSTGPNGSTMDVKGINVTLEHEFSSFTFKSISAYREMDGSFGIDNDGSPNQYVETDQKQTQEQFSQELQFLGTTADGKLDWLFGGFYMNEKGTDENDVRLVSGLYNALEALPVQLTGDPCAPPFVAPGCAGNPINPGLDLDFDIYNKIDITSYAIFTQLGYQLSERWNLNGGIRFTDETKDYTLEHLRVNSGVPIVPLTTVSESWSEPSGKIGINFQATNDLMVYGSVARGFKSGGFNGRPTTNSAVESFDPEFVTSYEVGLKSEFADRRVRLNAAIFLMDYTDMQVGSVSADASGNLILIIGNAAEAEVKGFEVDVVAVPAERWLMSAGVGYLDAEYLDTGTATDITTNSRFPKTPEWSGHASLQYALPVGADFGELRFRADWSFQSEVFQDTVNTATIVQSSFSQLSGRITLHNEAQNWDIVLSGTNLTDKIYVNNGLSALGAFGIVQGLYSPGRQWALSFSKRF